MAGKERPGTLRFANCASAGGWVPASRERPGTFRFAKSASAGCWIPAGYGPSVRITTPGGSAASSDLSAASTRVASFDSSVTFTR